MKTNTVEWLDPKKLYEIYGIPENTQAKLRMMKNRIDKNGKEKDGVLPFYKRHGHIRYKRCEIDKWFEEGRVNYGE